MKKETSNVLVAFLAGAVAGSVVALLFAPASGAETRKNLAGGLKKAKDKAVDGLESAKEYAESHKAALKEAYQEGKDAYQRSLKKSEA
jgi:gas vesicle protein